MAVYRFRVSFEDYDDIVRDVDIKSTQTFEDFHHAIHKSTGYPAEKSSSFFISNDQWIKGDEIAYLPTQRKTDRGVTLMSGTKLNRFIDDPHQKFYYVYNFDRPFDFHVELVKILDDEAGKEYPYVSRSVGEAPKLAGSVSVAATAADEDTDDLDFLNNMAYSEEDADDMSTVDELDEIQEEEEEEKDEFMDEFSDNDSFDSDDYNNPKDDY